MCFLHFTRKLRRNSVLLQQRESCRRPLDLNKLLSSTPQMLCKKLLYSSIEVYSVLRSCKTMSFVGIQNVFHWNTFFMHGKGDLIGFRLLHTWIVGALTN